MKKNLISSYLDQLSERMDGFIESVWDDPILDADTSYCLQTMPNYRIFKIRDHQKYNFERNVYVFNETISLDEKFTSTQEVILSTSKLVAEKRKVVYEH